MIAVLLRIIAAHGLLWVCLSVGVIALASDDQAKTTEGTRPAQGYAAVSTAPQSDSPSGPLLSAKLFRHADRVIARFDKDGSGRWEQSEWPEAQAALSLELEQLDADGDRVISALEVAEYIALFGRHRVLEPVVRTRQTLPQTPSLLRPSTPGASIGGSPGQTDTAKAQPSDGGRMGRESAPAAAGQPAKKFHVSPSRLPPGLPEWFLARDADGDGQLDFAEFAPQGGQWALEQFRRYDANEDGLITPQEVLGAKHLSGGDKSGPTGGDRSGHK